MQAKRTGIQAEAATMSCFFCIPTTFQFYMDQTYYVFHSWKCGSLKSIARKTFLCLNFILFLILFPFMASVISALFKFCSKNRKTLKLYIRIFHMLYVHKGTRTCSVLIVRICIITLLVDVS